MDHMDTTLDSVQSPSFKHQLSSFLKFKDQFKSDLMYECLQNALLFIEQIDSIVQNHFQFQHVYKTINTLMNNKKPMKMNEFYDMHITHVSFNQIILKHFSK